MAVSTQLPGVSLSCGATVGTAAYVLLALFNLYRMMNPLVGINLATDYPPLETPYVPPIWNLSRSEGGKKDEYLGLLVYMSHLDKFTLDFLDADDEGGEEDGDDKKAAAKAAVLLWDNPSIPASVLTSTSSLDDSLLHKSIILTTREHFQRSNGTTCSSGGDAVLCCPVSQRILSSHVSHTLVQEIGTSSFFIRFVEWIQNLWKSFYQWLMTDVATADGLSTSSIITDSSKNYSIVQLDQNGPIWRAMMNNRTIYLHVIVTKNKRPSTKKHHERESIRASTSQQRKQELISFSQKYSLLMGSVPLVKLDEPVPRKPTRILIYDILYLYHRYVQQSIPPTVPPPWDLLKASNDSNVGRKITHDYLLYQKTLQDKRAGVTYPYFKPEVAIKLVSDSTVYPLPIALQTGLDVVQRQSGGAHSYGYLPSLYVDEIGLTSEKYLHLNHTITDVPLRITLDTLSPQRHRLMSVLERSLKDQSSLGFEKSDIDDVRRLISDTNVILLGITVLASVLHLLFEFLTFKSDVDFWKKNTDLTGLSVRTLFGDLICQCIVLAYLMEQESSLLMTVPAAIGILIAAWKCQRAAGFQIVRHKSDGPWWRWKIQAKRLLLKKEDHESHVKSLDKDIPNSSSTSDRLDMLTLEMDKKAFNTLGNFLFPVVFALAFRSLLLQEYSSWYSWLIASASGSVYALGFVLMTPQLFLNYKLKSVAHLPWRVLCYKFLNTFIDDLFAFIIRMPTMARISCFRDDVVFFIYLFQRWMYPVDTSRPVEGGHSSN